MSAGSNVCENFKSVLDELHDNFKDHETPHLNSIDLHGVYEAITDLDQKISVEHTDERPLKAHVSNFYFYLSSVLSSLEELHVDKPLEFKSELENWICEVKSKGGLDRDEFIRSINDINSEWDKVQDSVKKAEDVIRRYIKAGAANKPG